jgi:hypothetical protein
MSQPSHVFYVPSTHAAIHSAIDAAVFRDGQTVGLYSHQTQEELARNYPGVTLGTVEEYAAQLVQAVRTEPVEITRQQYLDALEVLPPLDWEGRRGCESFKLSEFYTSNVTSIYARRGHRYFTFRAVATLSHQEIMARLPGA